MKWLAKDLLLKLASVLVALVLWMYVRSQAALQNTKDITFYLYTINTPADLMVLKMPTQITAKAEGSPEEIKRLTRAYDNLRDRRELSAYVDLGRAAPGAQQYRVFIPQEQRFPGYDLHWEWPGSVLITLGEKITKIQDVAFFPINTREGYEVKAAINPEKVVLSGTREVLDKVAQVRAQVDLENFKPGSVYRVNLEILDSNSQPIGNVSAEPSLVEVRPALSEALTKKTVLVSPTWKGQPAFGYKVKSFSVVPDELMIRSSSQDTLKRTATIETRQVDIEGLTKSRSFRVTLDPPPGVRASAKTVTVNVQIVAVPMPKRPVQTTPPVDPAHTTTPPPVSTTTTGQ